MFLFSQGQLFEEEFSAGGIEVKNEVFGVVCVGDWRVPDAIACLDPGVSVGGSGPLPGAPSPLVRQGRRVGN